MGWQSREVSEDWRRDSLPSIQEDDSAGEIRQTKYALQKDPGTNN